MYRTIAWRCARSQNDYRTNTIYHKQRYYYGTSFYLSFGGMLCYIMSGKTNIRRRSGTRAERWRGIKDGNSQDSEPVVREEESKQNIAQTKQILRQHPIRPSRVYSQRENQIKNNNQSDGGVTIAGPGSALHWEER